MTRSWWSPERTKSLLPGLEAGSWPRVSKRRKWVTPKESQFSYIAAYIISVAILRVRSSTDAATIEVDPPHKCHLPGSLLPQNEPASRPDAEPELTFRLLSQVLENPCDLILKCVPSTENIRALKVATA